MRGNLSFRRSASSSDSLRMKKEKSMRSGEMPWLRERNCRRSSRMSKKRLTILHRRSPSLKLRTSHLDLGTTRGRELRILKMSWRLLRLSYSRHHSGLLRSLTSRRSLVRSSSPRKRPSNYKGRFSNLT